MSDHFPYYDKQAHGFREVRKRVEEGVICSKARKYYSDSLTTKDEVLISEEYVEENLVEVGPLDKFEHATQNELGGWMIEDENG